MKITKTDSFVKSQKGQKSGSAGKVAVSDNGFKLQLDSLTENYDQDQSNRQSYSPKDWSEEILKSLDKIKLDIIDGKLSRSDLEKLNSACKSRITKTNDQALIEILKEVKQRALIELAKYS